MTIAFTDDTSLDENLGHRGGPTWKTPDPTPDEIYGPGGYLERIQATWTDDERRLRCSTMKGRPE
jgi:hypothetical protein